MDGCPLWVMCVLWGRGLCDWGPTDCGASFCVISEPLDWGDSNS
jgi:hypothetical protein